MRAASVARMAWVVAGMLVAGAAAAGPSPKSETKGGAETAPPVQSTTPTSGDDTTSLPQQENTTNIEQERRIDKRTDFDESDKKWYVQADMTTTHILEDYEPAAGVLTSQLVGGNANAEANNLFSFNVGYAFTSYDSLSLNWSLVQNPLIDSGDDSFRAGDIALTYIRRVPLPAKFNLTMSGTITAPTGYSSQVATNITHPVARFTLSRRFGDLTISAGINGGYFFDRCKDLAVLNEPGHWNCTEPGIYSGEPNAQWGAGANLGVNYTMPFYQPLSIGLNVNTEYARNYMPGTMPQGGGLAAAGVTGGSNLPGFTQGGAQPIQQGYGWTFFINYTIPEVLGIKSDATIGYGNGDTAAGENSVLHSGVIQPLALSPYLAFRDIAAVYGTLSVRY